MPASVHTLRMSAPLKFSASFTIASKSMSPCLVMPLAWIFKMSVRACSLGSGICGSRPHHRHFGAMEL